MGKYSSYSELKINEREGKDYQIKFRHGASGIAVIAPHGGGIEPGTTEIAEAVAGDGHSFYSFCGLKGRNNGDLHITSVQFDEPVVVRMASKLDTIVAIHGCRGDEEAVYVGGRDWSLRRRFLRVLNDLGVLALEDRRFPGMRPENVCNRSRSGKGVQLEISTGLRRLMFRDLLYRDRSRCTERFASLVSALRGVLAEVHDGASASSQPFPTGRAGLSEEETKGKSMAPGRDASHCFR